MRVSKAKLLVLIAMSAVGLVASAYVLIEFYLLKQNIICPSGSFYGISLDCGEVLGSPYSQVFGIPLELLALLYFVINISLVYIIAFGSEKIFKFSLQALFIWRFIGVAMVPYLVFVELFLLHAICVYCTLMHVAILTDFVVISYFLFFGENSLWALGLSDSESSNEAPDPTTT